MSLDHKTIMLATSFARRAHKGQVRKYTGEDYFYHVLEVAELLAILYKQTTVELKKDYDQVFSAREHLNKIRKTQVKTKELTNG